MSIRRKPEVKTPRLPDATIVIAVRTNQWQAAFGGGFTVSNLIGRVYALRDSVIPASGQTPASTNALVVRDEQREDDATYGTATFVHLYHSKHPWAAVSFGLGLSLNNATGSAYYLGPSYRFGDRGALTLGGVVGPVRTLPSGIRENDVASDRTTVSNALASPPTRNAVKAFIALSYNFLGGGADALNKPFAGSTTSTSAAGVTTPPSSRNAMSYPKALDARLAHPVTRFLSYVRNGRAITPSHWMRHSGQDMERLSHSACCFHRIISRVGYHRCAATASRSDWCAPIAPTSRHR